MQAKEIKQTGGKLGNAGFLAKAPDSVVAEIRAAARGGARRAGVAAGAGWIVLADTAPARLRCAPSSPGSRRRSPAASRTA